ncbi:MAG: HAD family acid phosphatase [Candidatus Eremiobacteraeota bacterium]|nr:HAD family acid phosphatase [Candidatus Eremiobacteraeota bacterium]MCW5866865.1 HAD family acid phosphatase [Candidatus Eremiobacteraeota bacterium]
MKSLLKSLSLLLFLSSAAFCEPADLHRDLTIPNMYLVKESMRHYYKSGQYSREIDAIAGQAQAYLQQNLARVRDRKPAIVLDIDETVLSNYPHINEFDFGYIPKEWSAWILRGEAPALVGPRELFRYARQNDVAVFFITGRAEKQREATLKNLSKEGFEGWQELVMKPDGDHSATGAYKAEHRKRLTEAGYTILVNLGDQASDLEGGYSEAVFKLPNPMYYVP